MKVFIQRRIISGLIVSLSGLPSLLLPVMSQTGYAAPAQVAFQALRPGSKPFQNFDRVCPSPKQSDPRLDAESHTAKLLAAIGEDLTDDELKGNPPLAFELPCKAKSSGNRMMEPILVARREGKEAAEIFFYDAREATQQEIALFSKAAPSVAATAPAAPSATAAVASNPPVFTDYGLMGPQAAAPAPAAEAPSAEPAAETSSNNDKIAAEVTHGSFPSDTVMAGGIAAAAVAAVISFGPLKRGVAGIVSRFRGASPAARAVSPAVQGASPALRAVPKDLATGEQNGILTAKAEPISMSGKGSGSFGQGFHPASPAVANNSGVKSMKNAYDEFARIEAEAEAQANFLRGPAGAAAASSVTR